MQIMQANTLLSVVKKVLKDPIDAEIPATKTNYEKLCEKRKPTSYFYNVSKTNFELMYNTFIRWMTQLKLTGTYEDFLKSIRSVYVITNNSKLRSFYYRLISFALVLNTNLYRWNIIDSDLCSFCQEGKETTEHIFYKCKKIQPYLLEIDKLVEYYHKKHVQLNLSIENVIFNSVHIDKKHLSNCITLILKSYIYSTRCLKKDLNIRGSP